MKCYKVYESFILSQHKDDLIYKIYYCTSCLQKQWEIENKHNLCRPCFYNSIYKPQNIQL